jgi:death on curing protein
MRYLTPAELYTINEEVLGRKPRVRDRHLLRAAALRPMTSAFGQEAYPTALDKAAALLHSLAYHHLFADGNKRTAARATVHFLRENGYQPAWDEAEAYAFILEVAQGRHTVEEIAAWLQAHTVPAG